MQEQAPVSLPSSPDVPISHLPCQESPAWLASDRSACKHLHMSADNAIVGRGSGVITTYALYLSLIPCCLCSLNSGVEAESLANVPLECSRITKSHPGFIQERDFIRVIPSLAGSQ